MGRKWARLGFFGAGIFVAQFACFGPSGVLVGPLPVRLDGPRVFAVEDVNGTWTVEVFGPGDEVSIRRLYDPALVRRLALMDYAAEPQVALPRGVLRQASANECGRFPLPAADLLREWHLSEDENWRVVDELNEGLAEFRYASICPCDSFEQIVHSIPTQSRVAVAASDERTYAIVFEDREIFEVDTNTIQPFRLDFDTSDFPMTTASGDGTGGLFLGSTRGRWGRWRPDAVFAPQPIVPTDARLNVIAGTPEALLIATNDGGLYDRGDGRWTTVANPGLDAMDQFVARIALDGPGRAVVALEDRDALLFVEDGAIVSQESALVRGAPIRNLVATTGYGVVTSTDDRRLFRRLADGWVELPSSAPSIQVVAAWRDGFLYAGNRGFFAEYLPGADACPLQGAVPSMSWRSIAVTRTMIVLGGVLEDDAVDRGESGKILVLRPSAGP